MGEGLLSPAHLLFVILPFTAAKGSIQHYTSSVSIRLLEQRFSKFCPIMCPQSVPTLHMEMLILYIGPISVTDDSKANMSQVIKFSPSTCQKRETHPSPPEAWQSRLLPPYRNPFPFHFPPCSLCSALLSTVRHAKLFPTPGPLHILATLSGMLFPPLPGHFHPPKNLLCVTSAKEATSLTSSSFMSSFPYLFPSWHFLLFVTILFIVCFFLFWFSSLEYEFHDGN